MSPLAGEVIYDGGMAILSDYLSVWEIAFRWAGLNPRNLWLRIPLPVQDHFRNMMDAILSAELACQSITLEKRDFEAHEKDFSVYYWLDDIYLCIWGHKFNRKLLRHASIERYDFMLWCERLNIPLPEFWFPPGWNLEYELPEGDIRPGHYYTRSHWTTDQWLAWRKELGEEEEPAPVEDETEGEQPESAPYGTVGASPQNAGYYPNAEAKHDDSVEKLRPNQHAKFACQQIASAIWKDEPNRTIASIVKDELIQKYGGGAPFVDATIREWVKVVAPPHVRERRGRPKKGAEDE